MHHLSHYLWFFAPEKAHKRFVLSLRRFGTMSFIVNSTLWKRAYGRDCTVIKKESAYHKYFLKMLVLFILLPNCFWGCLAHFSACLYFFFFFGNWENVLQTVDHTSIFLQKFHAFEILYYLLNYIRIVNFCNTLTLWIE